MITLLKWITLWLAAFLCTAAVQADEGSAQLPSPDQIRTYYQESGAELEATHPLMLNAFVASVDSHFFEKLPQYSRITQYIGTGYLTPRASKLHRLALSFVIAEALTHDEILKWYASKVYLGQDCFGTIAAAKAYFGKPVGELNLQEAAYLAALPVAPSAFHPVKSYSKAIARRNFVLARMANAGFITDGDAEIASQTDLIVLNPLKRCEQK